MNAWRELLRTAGVELDGAYYCHHHPDFTGARATAASPRPGCCCDAAAELGLDLARELDDRRRRHRRDAAHAAGRGAVLVEHPRTAHRRRGAVAPSAPRPTWRARPPLIAR